VDPGHGKWCGYFFKIWADRYSFNAEVKGGKIIIRPKIIIVTSQYTIEEVFTEERDREAINRRFKITNIDALNFFHK
jgi:hypothetical protein